MAIPKGFHHPLVPHGKEPGLWERTTYSHMLRNYKRRLANMTYLPEEIKKRVMTYSVDAPNMKEYKKMTATERYNLWEQMEKFMSLKSTTKRGYNTIISKRFKAWKEKVPELTREQFDKVTKNKLFNTAKKVLDSNQIISALKGVLENGDEDDMKVFMKILESTTLEDVDRKATQMEFARLLSKVIIAP